MFFPSTSMSKLSKIIIWVIFVLTVWVWWFFLFDAKASILTMTSDYSSQVKKSRVWLKDNVINKSNIVIIELGAGKDVPTVRNFSEEIQTQYNATLIRINPRDYDGNKETISISLGANEALEKIYT